jgi:hypothetical protein
MKREEGYLEKGKEVFAKTNQAEMDLHRRDDRLLTNWDHLAGITRKETTTDGPKGVKVYAGRNGSQTRG